MLAAAASIDSVHATQGGVFASTLGETLGDAGDLCVPTIAASSTDSASSFIPTLGGALKDLAVFSVEAALGSDAMFAYAAVEPAFGCKLFTLSPAHLALGFVEMMQADPSYELPPGLVTFVRPRRAALPQP